MPNNNRIPPGAIGFRLANELEGLLKGISADGIINDLEVQRLRRWLAENEQYAWLEPFSELARHLRRVLSDGRVTLEECEDLTFVTAKFTRVNPYFDQLRGGLQILNGLLAAVAADDDLPEAEARALSVWLEDWSHLRGLWPYEECHALVVNMLAQNRVGEYRQYLFDLAAQFPIAGDTPRDDAPSMLVRGVCAVDPVIDFSGRRFVFTGESNKCDRSTLERHVLERGGLPWPRVTKQADYLVVCDGGSPFWAFACYGRKVEQAYMLRRGGHPIMIVHEVDFWDARAGVKAV